MNMWQPIETAPKDGSSILLATPKGRIADGFWALTYGVWSWLYVMVEPTHWMPLPAPPGSQAQSTPNAVAYLDLGVGGYMDIGTDLTDEELATLPKGRHMLGVIGTYGVDGYVPAQPAPSVPECPYPCGWRNLLKHAIEDGAYLARSINEDEPVTENARSVTMRTVMRLRNVLMAINNAAPEAKP